MFYHCFAALIKNINRNLTDMIVIILKILTKNPKTQCDYYIDYVVHFN